MSGTMNQNPIAASAAIFDMGLGDGENLQKQRLQETEDERKRRLGLMTQPDQTPRDIISPAVASIFGG
jgi:hypothetical protein